MAGNHPLRRSTRHTGKDFNLYGLDPEGQKAHLVQHMYGLWKPPTTPMTRFSGKSQAAPRYGPPSSEQLAWLPPTFIQREPPMYYGKPCPPYLPPPIQFDLLCFDTLIPRPRSDLNVGGEMMQPLVPIAHRVWSLTVIYMIGDALHTYEFNILSSISWEVFQSVARTYLQLWRSCAQLGFRIRRNGILGELRQLKSSLDWTRAMEGICQAGQMNVGGELVIFNLDAIQGLSNKLLDVEVYSFDYPTVDDLLRRLDLSEIAQGDPSYIDQKGRQGLRIAGMSYIDDFTMLSPVELSIVTRILPEKVSTLYNHVSEMIQCVHDENKEDIESIARILGPGGGF